MIDTDWAHTKLSPSEEITFLKILHPLCNMDSHANVLAVPAQCHHEVYLAPLAPFLSQRNAKISYPKVSSF